MHNEYAVEPGVIASSWERCRYLSEKFGFDRGRVLALFPKKWAADAIGSVNSNLGEIEKERIRNKVLYLSRHCSVSSGRDFHPKLGNWIENAIQQQNSNDKPFHAIIISKKLETKCSSILAIDEIEENHPKIQANSSRIISRDQKSLVNAFDVLLRAGSQITFIDPYFSFYEIGYISILSECLRLIGKSCNQGKRSVRIHYSTEKKSSIDEIERSPVINQLEMPSNIILEVYGWKKNHQGNDLHDRYLLTENGGIQIGWGFKPAKSTSKTTLSLLDRNASEEILKSFDQKSEDYLPDGALKSDSSGQLKLRDSHY